MSTTYFYNLQKENNYRNFNAIVIRPNGDMFLFANFGTDEISVKMGNKYAIFELCKECIENQIPMYLEISNELKYPPLVAQLSKIIDYGFIYKFKEYTDTAENPQELPQPFYTNTQLLDVIEQKLIATLRDKQISIEDSYHNQ